MCVSMVTAKDVVRKLLVVDPSERMTIDAALQHPWLQVPNKTYRHFSVSTMVDCLMMSSMA